MAAAADDPRVEHGDALEFWLNKATNPLNKKEEWEDIMGFCNKVNLELEGPLHATRLLSHKIQSPQEWEAMQSLTVLEACMRNCGKRFHDEVGKYRFLNELIKVLSPKYLGSRSPEKVKSKIVELMYSWTVGIPDETKIQDAYHMLKGQGIVKADPKLSEDNIRYIVPPPPPRHDNTLFEDEEKSKLLARLLKSTHPEDLEAANRLIKTVVKEDQAKMERVAKRINALEEVEKSVRQLRELVAEHRRGGGNTTTSAADGASISEAYRRCERMRPTLFKLASDTEDNEDALADILRANDELTSVMETYKSEVERLSTVNGMSSPTAAPTKGGTSSLIELAGLEVAASPAATLLDDELMSLNLTDATQTSAAPTPLNWTSFQLGSALMDGATLSVTAGTPAEAAPVAPAPVGGLQELEQIGKSLLQQALPPGTQQVKWASTAPKQTLRELQQSKMETAPKGAAPVTPVGSSSVPTPAAAAGGLLGGGLPLAASPSSSFAAAPSSSVSTSLLTPAVATPPTSLASHTASSPARPGGPAGQADISLTNVFVPLDSIKPSNAAPITAYDRHGLRVLLHFSRGCPPGRPDVLVVVLSVISTAPQPISGLLFQAAVPKNMRVKLQPASGTELPGFNPLQPPAAVTQVMLLANPNKEKVRLRFRLAFTLGEEVFSEVGEVVDFPPAESWSSL
ncbi:LOW QUALITY PROTEIN: ADP-ribosylation factor-binding protein GGA1-like [Lethenteron reissneri]|uniref:LOW QUALITY PROTEIN: ADP-ribosylation factor-binding protein GGA1-like n=1 Tax=Lethenteron reissneri TaxID=7753 RepID=UPI002AB76CAA|nr:LOW QUALITY PROTEIN: ADP-ribosylation factor-binding protein GGA1-like [Lethenteron reissneri]